MINGLNDAWNYITEKVGEAFSGPIYNALIQFCLFIDRLIYSLITRVYSVFLAVGSSEIVSNDIVSAFMVRIYTVISVVMLFIIAYSFMNVVINPDNVSKKDSSPTKIVRNIIIALLAIVFIPAGFRLAYTFQETVVVNQVINKIVLGSEKTNVKVRAGNNKYNQNDLAVYLFESNFYIKEPDEDIDCTIQDNYEKTECTYEIAHEMALNFGDMDVYAGLTDKVQSQEIEYNFIVSLLLGGFTLYVLVIYCFDVSLRAVKLLALELVAPIPALLYIVPGQTKVFGSWIKATIKTYLEIFIKIAILTFGIFFLSTVIQSIQDGSLSVEFLDFSRPIKYAAQTFIIFGVVLFIRQAPSLLADIFGIKIEKGAFSLRKRLADSGALAAFGLASGGLMAGRAAYKGSKARGNRLVGRWASAFASAPRGAFTGLRAGWKGEVKGIGTSYNESLETQFYRARGATTLGVMVDHLRDNFGVHSVYDEESKLIDISTESKIHNIKISVRNAEAVSRERINEINRIEAAGNSSNSAARDIRKRMKETIDKEKFDINSDTVLEVELPTLVKYDSEQSRVGENVGDILDGLGIAGSWDVTDETGTVRRSANYSTIRRGVSRLDQDIENYTTRSGSINAEIESINAELATLNPRTSGRRYTELEARRATLQTQLTSINTDMTAVQAQRSRLVDAMETIERRTDRNQMVDRRVSVNAHAVKDSQENLAKNLTDAGFTDAEVASIVTSQASKYKDIYKQFDKAWITKDLSSGTKSKLRSDLAEYVATCGSASFANVLEVDSNGNLVVSTNKDADLLSAADSLKRKRGNISSITGEELVTSFDALDKRDNENKFAKQESMRRTTVTFEDGYHKKQRMNLSETTEFIKQNNEIIKAEQERQKISKEAIEDHQNNAAQAKSGKK